MKILLDTHAFLWFVWNDPRLGAVAIRHIEEPDNDLYLSAGSIWEIAIKVGTGKLSVGMELEAFLVEQMNRNRVVLLPISVSHVARLSTLPPIHMDPFDRLLIAQSLAEDMPFISNE